MAIGTDFGAIDLSAKDVADACRIGPTGATRKMKAWETNVVRSLRALKSVTTGKARDPFNLAGMLLCAMETGGALLCRLPEDKKATVRARVVELAENHT